MILLYELIFLTAVVDFFNRINLIYGTVSESCTEASCPTMSGGRKYEYHWCDKDQYKKPTKLPAPKYISLLMDWVESQINNEEIFPVSVGKWLRFYITVRKKIRMKRRKRNGIMGREQCRELKGLCYQFLKLGL